MTVQDLIDNWRSELNRINADVLEGVALTDSEFEQVMSKVNQISNSYEAAKILSIEVQLGRLMVFIEILIQMLLVNKSH